MKQNLIKALYITIAIILWMSTLLMSSCAVHNSMDAEYRDNLNKIVSNGEQPALFFNLEDTDILRHGQNRVTVYENIGGPVMSYTLKNKSTEYRLELYDQTLPSAVSLWAGVVGEASYSMKTGILSGNIGLAGGLKKDEYFRKYLMIYADDVLWQWGTFESLSKTGDPNVEAIITQGTEIIDDFIRLAIERKKRNTIVSYGAFLISLIAATTYLTSSI
ncbi:MAG: hypothetical protein HQ556_10325 [Candidatus Marinimicrobia bacterium]|nr:hypothetical protein [Candidatus Neomarinimicrobiota bacterium]